MMASISLYLWSCQHCRQISGGLCSKQQPQAVSYPLIILRQCSFNNAKLIVHQWNSPQVLEERYRSSDGKTCSRSESEYINKSSQAFWKLSAGFAKSQVEAETETKRVLKSNISQMLRKFNIYTLELILNRLKSLKLTCRHVAYTLFNSTGCQLHSGELTKHFRKISSAFPLLSWRGSSRTSKEADLPACSQRVHLRFRRKPVNNNRTAKPTTLELSMLLSEHIRSS